MPATTPSEPFVAFAAGSAPTATTNSSVMDWGWTVNNHDIVVTGGAGITTGTFQLQGSHDNVNWFPIGATVAATANTVSTPTQTALPCRYVRVNTTVSVAGGTVTVTVCSI